MQTELSDAEDQVAADFRQARQGAQGAQPGIALDDYVACNGGYVAQTGDVAIHVAVEAHRPVLLMAHSMGSVIAFDTLWEMTHNGIDHVDVDLFLTMGSPLGQDYIQKRINGNSASGRQRYPGNVRHWKNLSAVGDLTAIDPWLANDFSEMLTLGLVDTFHDKEIYSAFRYDGAQNVHSEYGYLANEMTAEIVAGWWRSHDSSIVAA